MMLAESFLMNDKESDQQPMLFGSHFEPIIRDDCAWPKGKQHNLSTID